MYEHIELIAEWIVNNVMYHIWSIIDGAIRCLKGKKKVNIFQ